METEVQYFTLLDGEHYLAIKSNSVIYDYIDLDRLGRVFATDMKYLWGGFVMGCINCAVYDSDIQAALWNPFINKYQTLYARDWPIDLLLRKTSMGYAEQFRSRVLQSRA